MAIVRFVLWERVGKDSARPIAVLGLIVVVGGIVYANVTSRLSKMEGPDKAVVDQSIKLGDDLSKPREVEFFLYFPTEESTYEASVKVRDLGFNVTVELSGYDARWLCFATKRMVLDLEELVRIREQFEALAVALDGEYDGWGTGVEL